MHKIVNRENAYFKILFIIKIEVIALICSLSDLRNKEVINIRNGARLGYVDDLEINTEDSTVIAMVVYGRPRCFGLFGRDDDIVIRCKDIELIGEDTILVVMDNIAAITKSNSFSIENLFK